MSTMSNSPWWKPALHRERQGASRLVRRHSAGRTRRKLAKRGMPLPVTP